MNANSLFASADFRSRQDQPHGLVLSKRIGILDEIRRGQRLHHRLDRSLGGRAPTAAEVRAALARGHGGARPKGIA